MATFEYDLMVLPIGMAYPIGRIIHGTVTVDQPSQEYAAERLYTTIEDKYGYARDEIRRMSLALVDE